MVFSAASQGIIITALSDDIITAACQGTITSLLQYFNCSLLGRHHCDLLTIITEAYQGIITAACQSITTAACQEYYQCSLLVYYQCSHQSCFIYTGGKLRQLTQVVQVFLGQMWLSPLEKYILCLFTYQHCANLAKLSEIPFYSIHQMTLTKVSCIAKQLITTNRDKGSTVCLKLQHIFKTVYQQYFPYFF